MKVSVGINTGKAQTAGMERKINNAGKISVKFSTNSS